MALLIHQLRADKLDPAVLAIIMALLGVPAFNAAAKKGDDEK